MDRILARTRRQDRFRRAAGDLRAAQGHRGREGGEQDARSSSIRRSSPRGPVGRVGLDPRPRDYEVSPGPSLTCMIIGDLPSDLPFHGWRPMVVDGPKRPFCGHGVGTVWARQVRIPGRGTLARASRRERSGRSSGVLPAGSLHSAVEKRVDHATEALGADIGVAALAVEGQGRQLAAAYNCVEDLPAAAVALGHEVPPPLPGQAERPSEPA